MSEYLKWGEVTLPGFIHSEANRVAERGDVAIVGLAIPWNDFNNAHGEVMRPGTLASGIAPPLFDGHPENAATGDGRLGQGYLSVNAADGLYCVWKLDPSVVVFDRLIEAASAGETGLSIAFIPGERRDMRRGGQPVVEHVSGTLGSHVALTGSPSFENARVLAVVGAWATLVHRPGRGLVLVGSASQLIAQREQVALKEYAATLDPGVIPLLPPAIQRFEADHARGR